MFTYVTSNINKIASAQSKLHHYKIAFEHQALDLVEIQAENIKTIALDKAAQAFKILQKPVVVADAGWSISVLNGFPGPYMHYVHDWLGTKWILKMLDGVKDRRILLESVLVYQDEKEAKVFSSVKHGVILEKPVGRGKLELDKIFSFRSDRKSIAECIDHGLDKFDERKSNWDEFAKWYKTK